MAKTRCNRKCCSILLIICGIILALGIAVCLIIGVFNKLIHENINKNVELKKDSETFKSWQSPSSSVYMQYFMFNVTNPNPVQNGSKPFVKQVGPYSYREIRHNVPVNFNDSAYTIVYLSQKAYIFDPSTSCAGCDPLVDTIFTINIPLLKMSQLIMEEINKIVAYLRSFLDKLIYDFVNSELLKMEPVFEEKSIHDLLWGYNDTFLADAKNIEDKINKYLPNKFKIRLRVDPLIKLQSNNSNMSSEIHTGVGNIDRVGQYVSWNNSRTLNWWGTNWANMINGTDGSMFHPSVSTDEKLYCFVSDVCRSLYLNYDSTVTVRGITLYRYFTPPKLFEYTPVVKAGFCVPTNRTCVPDGLLDISTCQNGVPLVVSLPHFLFANQSVINEVGGLHPKKEDHATFISIEPNTGITMKTNKRIQINVAVDKIVQLKKLSKLRKLYLPVMFVNETACINEDDANKFKKSVYLPMNAINIGKYVLLGFGCLLLIIGLLLLSLSRKKPKVVLQPSVQQVDAADPDERTPLTRQMDNYIG